MDASAHLAKLNPAQRVAVEHGIGPSKPGPLLIIAGAGSGKTNTLAHRVAHLIVNGTDPGASCCSHSRAAPRWRWRGGSSGSLPGDRADGGGDGRRLTWSGTFHAVGARLLRRYAREIGLDPAFTILDRGDSADLMNLARHELGFSEKESRFPTKDTCLAIYSRPSTPSAAGRRARLRISLVREWEAELRALFAAYVAAKQRQNVVDYDDLLLYWAR